MSIPQDIIDAVRERTSFVEVASEHVTLKRSGKSHVGLCPFHSEKTPSFHVNDEEGLFYCFGCGEKGTVFDFITKTRGFSFPEAVRFLAGRVGIQVPEESHERKERRDARTAHAKLLRELVQAASHVYHETLVEGGAGNQGREYFRKRGIGEETIRTFSLGFAPDRWNFIEEKLAQHFQSMKSTAPDLLDKLPQALSEIGLIKERRSQVGDEEKGYYDIFRKRAIFPISRSDGAPIAFGARLLESRDRSPKYLNSSESLLYAKRRSFYGLSQAFPYLRKTRHAFLVEGYMDVLSMHQMGFGTSLATCGTAITVEHAQILRRIADRVTIVFDGDAAGRKAAALCFQVFLNTGVDLSVVVLAEGQDPDSLAQQCSRQEFEKVILQHQKPIVELYIDQLKAEVCYDQGSEGAPGSRSLSAAASGKVAARYAAVIAGVQNSVERELRIRQGAEHLGVSARALGTLVVERLERRTTYSSAPAARDPVRQIRSSEDSSQVSSIVPVESTEIEPEDSKAVESPGDTASELAPYFRQVIVAVVCEPALARNIMNIPSVLSGQGVFETFPENIRQFLEEISQTELRGVSDWDLEVEKSRVVDPESERMEALLEKFGISGYGLLEEAIRQSTIGGGQPGEVVADASKAAARYSLKDEMERIRLKESRESNISELERLAQEKLDRKRSLERLRGNE